MRYDRLCRSAGGPAGTHVVVGRGSDKARVQIEALPWQKRDAVRAAVSRGRAVQDENLAALAAEWAAERQRGMQRIYLRVLAPMSVLIVVPMLWLVMRNDPKGSLGSAVFAGIFSFVVGGLVTWAFTWRPLVRAEKANRALLGLSDPPSRREPSHWVMAWLVAWPIGLVVGVLLRAAGVTLLAGPAGFVVWFATVWAVKRSLDTRHRS
jgi:hypothetical protein